MCWTANTLGSSASRRSPATWHGRYASRDGSHGPSSTSRACGPSEGDFIHRPGSPYGCFIREGSHPCVPCSTRCGRLHAGHSWALRCARSSGTRADLRGRLPCPCRCGRRAWPWLVATRRDFSPGFPNGRARPVDGVRRPAASRPRERCDAPTAFVAASGDVSGRSRRHSLARALVRGRTRLDEAASVAAWDSHHGPARRRVPAHLGNYANLVTKSISGQVTDRMKDHYSTVSRATSRLASSNASRDRMTASLGWRRQIPLNPSTSMRAMAPRRMVIGMPHLLRTFLRERPLRPSWRP